MAAKLNLAVLISGRGSNMQALIEACKADDFPARVALVLSNRPDAGGLQIAQDAGIQTASVDHKAYDSKAAFEGALQDVLSSHEIDLICLAGFMRLLSADFIGRWPDQIINIHPSLLPAYKGLDTHARAIADGAVEAGCTVHVVIPEMDAGPVILQKKVPVLAGDTPDALAARVLAQEHAAYPEAVRAIGDGRIRLVDGSVKILEE
ncbi:MAG: phosphoribosylglycinamide formyltransferase [Rhodospirillales bacterium]|nr:phosphoribosylglycinamide formyltransferase [Rhodospirillales bacterium]MCB9996946.1 phosphoribosylglycinamide formyltransferase [Rhodospirillales bacterium]